MGGADLPPGGAAPDDEDGKARRRAAAMRKAQARRRAKLARLGVRQLTTLVHDEDREAVLTLARAGLIARGIVED